MSDDPSSPKPVKANVQHPRPKTDLLDQFSPGYGYDENGMWCGMTRAEVEAFIAEQKQREAKRRLDEARLRMLAQWKPGSRPH